MDGTRLRDGTPGVEMNVPRAPAYAAVPPVSAPRTVPAKYPRLGRKRAPTKQVAVGQGRDPRAEEAGAVDRARPTDGGADQLDPSGRTFSGVHEPVRRDQVVSRPSIKTSRRPGRSGPRRSRKAGGCEPSYPRRRGSARREW